MRYDVLASALGPEQASAVGEQHPPVALDDRLEGRLRPAGRQRGELAVGLGSEHDLGDHRDWSIDARCRLNVRLRTA